MLLGFVAGWTQQVLGSVTDNKVGSVCSLHAGPLGEHQHDISQAPSIIAQLQSLSKKDFLHLL